jgi:hypothetical protein
VGNACLNDATYIFGRGGDIPVALPLLSGAKTTDINVIVHNPFQLCVANNMPYTGTFECAPRNIPSSNTGNIPTSRNIPSNVVNNPTRKMSNDASTKIPFGNCSKIPSSSSGTTRNIPTFVTRNIPTSGNIPRNTSMDMPIYTSTHIPERIISHSPNNMGNENSIIQPIVCCTTSVANSNSTWNAGSLNSAANIGIPPVSSPVHLSRCGLCQSMQGGNVVSATGQQTNQVPNQVFKPTAAESDQTSSSIPCAMLNVQNSQATEPRAETPQI